MTVSRNGCRINATEPYQMILVSEDNVLSNELKYAIFLYIKVTKIRVPIYCTWVEIDNCGRNAIAKGVFSKWDLNPQPHDYK